MNNLAVIVSILKYIVCYKIDSVVMMKKKKIAPEFLLVAVVLMLIAFSFESNASTKKADKSPQNQLKNKLSEDSLVILTQSAKRTLNDKVIDFLFCSIPVHLKSGELGKYFNGDTIKYHRNHPHYDDFSLTNVADFKTNASFITIESGEDEYPLDFWIDSLNKDQEIAVNQTVVRYYYGKKSKEKFEYDLALMSRMLTVFDSSEVKVFPSKLSGARKIDISEIKLKFFPLLTVFRPVENFPFVALQGVVHKKKHPQQNGKKYKYEIEVTYRHSYF